ncbi:hypothetical protein CAPTEDRAFT_198171 [Capitella teleta]|uniref:C2H2-type domain-containing protein n=1 Tax=Capitella teleta TaxID=283909 RepID=X1ZYC5_CAPTE|nr:hypothetical protein CAPTEDRAFT_198171 [Capitella teleta]|eukprot:ELU04716.1 hypothetical protein CAPTEDRAFT_198171 [Capitella teleta]
MANYGGYGRGMQQGYKRAGSPQFNTSSNKIRSYGNRDYGGHSHEQDMNFTSFDYGHQPAQHEEEDTTWRYCKLCNIQFSDKKHYVAHCGGLMHAQKQLMMENTSVPLRDDYNGGMQPRNDLRNEMRNSIPTHDDLPPRQSEMHECPAFLKQYAELGDSLFYQKFGNRIKFGMTIMDYPEPITPALRHIHWSGILNKFECRLCRAKCNTYPQWQQHCMSIPHAQTATELIGRMGREKFAIVYGDLPNNREQALNEYDDANCEFAIDVDALEIKLYFTLSSHHGRTPI